jgi:3-oxo-4-pregnene-20-carboxyl-CoA dehydrogenase alpha subunit
MDFTLTETQQAVADLAAQVLTGPDPWKALAQAGLLEVSPPDGLGVPEVTVLLTEIGRRAPTMKALSMTSALAMLRWGRAVPGEMLLTAAIREPSDPEPDPPATALANGRITGTKIGVPYAAEAHLLLVPARVTSPPPPRSASMIMGSLEQIAPKNAHDHGVALVDPRAQGVTLTRTPSSTGEPEYALQLEQAPVESVLGGAECVCDLYRLAVAGACALADGAVAGALALTRDHVATREQFGRPLAAFQAVSQQIADTYIASRTLHLATMAACWRLDPNDLDVAAYWCTEQAPTSVRLCHHLHGGVGMDVTYPLHRYSALVSDLVRFLGGAQYRLDRCSST